MTDKKSRRVVIINNINSDSIDQAIFILKSDPATPSREVNSSIVKEAQSIIDNYIRQVERLKDDYSMGITHKMRHKKLPLVLFLILAALSAVCLGLAYTVFHIS